MDTIRKKLEELRQSLETERERAEKAEADVKKLTIELDRVTDEKRIIENKLATVEDKYEIEAASLREAQESARQNDVRADHAETARNRLQAELEASEAKFDLLKKEHEKTKADLLVLERDLHDL